MPKKIEIKTTSGLDDTGYIVLAQAEYDALLKGTYDSTDTTKYLCHNGTWKSVTASDADTALGERIDTERNTANNEYVKNMLHLGAYDTYTYDSTTGIYTVTRQTGYFIFNDASKFTLWPVANSKIGAMYKDCALSRAYYTGTLASKAWTMCNSKGLSSITENDAWAHTIGLALNSDTNYIKAYLGDSYQTIDSIISYLLGTTVQYKLSTPYTETYEPSHFARIEPYALEHAKSEADRSSNLCDNATFLDGVNLCNCSANYSNGQLNIVSTGSDSYIGEYSISPYNPKCGKRINVKPDTTYTLSTGSSDITKNFITLYDSNGTKVSSIWCNYTNITTFTTPSTCAFIVIRVGNGSSVAGTTYSFNIMLVEGSHALPYQPYEGKTVHETGLTKSAVGLSNVDNTADKDKPYLLPLRQPLTANRIS
jgi:hypothetical protein